MLVELLEPRYVLSVPVPAIDARYGQLPLTFEKNVGQSDPSVSFLSRGEDYALFLTSTEAVLRVRGTGSEAGARPSDPTRQFSQDAVLRMGFVDANAAPRIEGLDEQEGKSNYLIDRDPQQWHIGVQNYSRVLYEDLYPGIDAVFYGTSQRQLEYDIHVAPGADPASVAVRYSGADSQSLDTEGNLVLLTAVGAIVQHAPRIYQTGDSGPVDVPGSYVLREDGTVGFSVAAYDKTRPLVIDPLLVYSTYLGGSGNDTATVKDPKLPFYPNFLSPAAGGLAADAQGAAYLVGTTLSTDFPVQGSIPVSPAASHVFIAKLAPDGSSLVYSTLIGGSGVSGTQGVAATTEGQAIAVDSTGAAIITGFTNDVGFPVSVNAAFPTPPIGNNAFVCKLNPTGTDFEFSTYLGGGNNDRGSSLAVDQQGNCFVAGITQSQDFPVSQNAAKATLDSDDDGFIDFVTKFDSSGGIVFSTYLGGEGVGADSNFSAQPRVAVDGSGNAIVTGNTFGRTLTATAGAYRETAPSGATTFACKLSATGAVLFTTFVAGSDASG